MMRNKGLSALLVTALSFAAGAGASALAPSGAALADNGAAGGQSWRIVQEVHSGALGTFTAVTAVGSDGGWAFNGIVHPTAWERDGTVWSEVPFPGQADGEQVIAAAATSPTDVWAFTAGVFWSRALRWNGHAWTVMREWPYRQIGGAAVLGPDNVWVFGEPVIPGADLGAWHYNGRTWTQSPGGSDLEGGSALSADDVWAFDGPDVAHWNGAAWTRTSVASLLPPRNQFNAPQVTGIYAQSPDSVYAIGNGNQTDDGGPLVVLHYNGTTWAKVAEGNYGFGTAPLQDIASDGRGGLWLPMPGSDGQRSYLLHYSGGTLTPVPLPVSSSMIDVDAVALIPGTTDLLGGGYIHASGNVGTDVVSILLQYGN
jgi:hypothetical protein